MKNLLKAEFYKQRVNGTLKMYILIMSLAGAVQGISVINKDSWLTAYNIFMGNSVIVTMIIATLAAIYNVGDFNDKSLHHGIMEGYSRGKIVLSKFIIYTIDVTLGLLLYFLLGIIILIGFSGAIEASNYHFSIVNYVLAIVVLKVLYLITFNVLCISFCFLVRNSAAFFLIVLSIWTSFIGELSNVDFIKNNSILRNLLKGIIMTQDKQIFGDRMVKGALALSKNEITTFVMVMVITIIVFYLFTIYIFSKVEIK